MKSEKRFNLRQSGNQIYPKQGKPKEMLQLSISRRSSTSSRSSGIRNPGYYIVPDVISVPLEDPRSLIELELALERTVRQNARYGPLNYRDAISTTFVRKSAGTGKLF